MLSQTLKVLIFDQDLKRSLKHKINSFNPINDWENALRSILYIWQKEYHSIPKNILLEKVLVAIRAQKDNDVS